MDPARRDPAKMDPAKEGLARKGLAKTSLSKASLLAIALAGAVNAAGAQTAEDKWRQDLKPLVPPVVPLPPNSQLNPGSVGGASNPYTTAPLQNSTATQTPTQPAPGLRLTIPTR